MTRVTVPGVILLSILAVAACRQPAQSAETTTPAGKAASIGGGPATPPAAADRPGDAEAAGMIETALGNRLTNETAPGATEPCGGLFDLLSVTVAGGSGDGARAEIAYDARVRAHGDYRATDRYSRCYAAPGGGDWTRGQVAAVRQTAEFQRVDGAWRLTRIR